MGSQHRIIFENQDRQLCFDLLIYHRHPISQFIVSILGSLKNGLSIHRRVNHRLRLQVVLCMLFHKSNQALQRTVTIVVDEFTCASGFELERGEPSDTEWNRFREVVFLGFKLCTEEA